MPKRHANTSETPSPEMAVPQEDAALAAFDIDTFCRLHRISRGLLYQLWKRRQGPRFFRAGARRLISAQAATEWVRDREAEAAKVA